MAGNTSNDRISFEKWLINLNEEWEVPMRLLNSTLEQLVEDESESTKKEQLQIALDLSHKFAGLMRNLNLAALEQTKMALLRISKIDLVKLIQQTIGSFEMALQANKADVHLHINTELPPVFLDAYRIHKIMATLLSNAIQFAKEGGARIDVSLDLTNSNMIRLSVQDDGIGIVPEKLAYVFDPLYDDDPVHLKLYQSTSAGLYLALLYSRAMGGNITVESQKMTFTRFTVSLPLITEMQKINFNNFEMVDSREEFRESQERIWAVNRDFSIQKQESFNTTTALALCREDIFKDFESWFNHEVRLMKVADSALAIARALHLKPQMIILYDDDDYGDIAAEQVAKTLKSHEITKAIPLVWISDHKKLNEADINVQADLPPNEIFEKIADLMNLRQKLIRELLEDKEMQTTKPRYQNNKEAFLTRLERIVDAHLSRSDLDMTKLSKMLFLNRSQIHRKVKLYTGMNTTEYIRNYKLKIAYRDLQQQRGTISEIAYRCGFNSPSYFSKSFKDVFGIAPSDVIGSKVEKA